MLDQADDVGIVLNNEDRWIHWFDSIEQRLKDDEKPMTVP
jgi:hypothetical protein